MKPFQYFKKAYTGPKLSLILGIGGCNFDNQDKLGKLCINNGM